MNDIELKSAAIIIMSWENRFAYAGGIRAVTQKYAKYLQNNGQKTYVLTPFHIGLLKVPIIENKINTFNFEFNGKLRMIEIYQDQWEQVNWIYIRCDDFFKAEGGRDRSNPYLYDYDAEMQKLEKGSPRLVEDCLLFAAVAPKILTALNLKNKLILHLQDWETAAVALTIKDAIENNEFSDVVTALALHNPYDSNMNLLDVQKDGWELISNRIKPDGEPTFLARLIPIIDAPPTTVSREFAVDLTSDPLQTQHLADHLQRLFIKRGITGIDNGPFGNYTLLFAKTAIEQAQAGQPDAILAEKQQLRCKMVETICNYKPEEQWGKINFDSLVKDKSNAPVFMCVGRLDPGQKGYDVLARAIELLFSENFEGYFILAPMIGNAPQPYIDDLKDLADECDGHVVIYPVQMKKGYSEIQAGSSFSLWPSMYEPFGGVSEFLLQGTPIIARSTGGLRQQIVNFDKSTGKGNGVIYQTAQPNSSDYSIKFENEWRLIQREVKPHNRLKYPLYKDQVAKLVEAIKTAVEIMNDPVAYGKLLSNLFNSTSGYSWERAAMEYYQNYARR